MDHYQLLGISRTANRDEIKQAYRKLALKYHPDKNRASDAGEKFKSLHEAYKILSDDQKRELYNRFDLGAPKTSTSVSSEHKSGPHHRKRDEKFFTGESDSEKRREQRELDRIRQINSELLESVNRQFKRTSSKVQGSRISTNTRERIFVGNIKPELSDEDYEKFVLGELTKIARSQ